MDFKTRRIRHHIKETYVNRISKPEPAAQPGAKSVPGKPPVKLNPHLKAQLYTIGGGIFILLVLLFLIFQVVRSLDFSSIIFSFGKSMMTDDKGNTNILLAGIGGEGHDGSDLTDTIIVASINYKTRLVPMLSIPRDLYVETKQTGRSRINFVYYAAIKKYGQAEAMNVLKEAISQIAGVPIQYYVKIDFKGFEKIVDSIGGVDVVLENDIYDTQYPVGETNQTELFSMKAGPHHLDGATALKYARSRHGSGRGDFDRAKRQQQLLYAIKDKALSLNILTDPSKIQALYNSVGESIETNLSLAEIIEMAKLAKDLGKESTMPVVINDDPTECGGFVYTPAREYFGDASVLLPAGNSYDYIHLLTDSIFYNPAPFQTKEKVQILNGTKVPGLALEGMNMLSRYCINVAYYSNAENRGLDTSAIYYRTDENGNPPAILPVINKLMPGLTNQAGIPPSYLEGEKRNDSSVVVELGKDYLTKRMKDPFDELKYLAPPTPKTTQQDSETGTSQKT